MPYFVKVFAISSFRAATKAGIAHSAQHLSCHKLRGSSMLHPGLEFNQCLYMYKYVDGNELVTILAAKLSASIALEVNVGNPLYAGDKVYK